LSCRSFAAVDGGLPDVFADASARQSSLLPKDSRTPMRPCDGSSSV